MAKPSDGTHMPNNEAHIYLVSQFDEVIVQNGKCDALSGKYLHDSLRQSLKTPPMATTLRINSLKYRVCDAQSYLLSYLSTQETPVKYTLSFHPDIPDMVGIPIEGPRTDLAQQKKKIIVDIQCGNSVLRGADVYAPGVLGAPKSLMNGDYVSVYSDMDGRCLKGTATEYCGSTVFVGNGLAKMSREELFGCNKSEKGCVVRMTDSLYCSPSFNGPGQEDMLFLQNLPSIVTSHVLDPKPGETVLDMCAAPGGKTVHIATMMQDQGCLVALDKSSQKVQKLMHNVKKYRFSCVQCFKFDSTKALSTGSQADLHGPPPFSRESFDKILLDAPCSALGQRPQFTLTHKLSDLKSYPHYQRMLLKQAIGLLKVGGTLVYSTCTYTPDENECQVMWVLKEFKNITLVDQYPRVGYSGLPGFGLDEKDLQKLQRFWPQQFGKILDELIYHGASKNNLPLNDTIAFFIAKFVKF